MISADQHPISELAPAQKATCARWKEVPASTPAVCGTHNRAVEHTAPLQAHQREERAATGGNNRPASTNRVPGTQPDAALCPGQKEVFLPFSEISLTLYMLLGFEPQYYNTV